MQTILMFMILVAQGAPPQGLAGDPPGLAPICKYIIGGLVTALLAVAAWGAKQARNLNRLTGRMKPRPQPSPPRLQESEIAYEYFTA